MKIGIIGTGYVGLTTGACLADLGHQVCAIDSNPDIIKTLETGEIPIFEPRLRNLVTKNTKTGRLSFSTQLSDLVGSQAIFIAVGTPQNPDGTANLTFVEAAINDIANYIQEYTVLVVKSTIPIGTNDDLDNRLARLLDRRKFSIVSNPEFLREGSAVKDFMEPDRIVIGCEDDRAAQVMKSIYNPLISAGATLLETDRRSAEITKYASNAFLATKLSFINEIAGLCEKVDANILDVTKGMGLDNRIGPHFLNPGPGYGGSCFPKDTTALAATANQLGVPLAITNAAIETNDSRKKLLTQRIIDRFDGDLKGLKIAILGLAFKANTDDVRESPAMSIIPPLVKLGADVSAYDPEAMDAAASVLSGVRFCTSKEDALGGCDAAVILTEWSEFSEMNLTDIAAMMKQKILFDFRNLFERDEAAQLGFCYYCLGRADIS